jgi:hypothetical protein
VYDGTAGIILFTGVKVVTDVVTKFEGGLIIDGVVEVVPSGASKSNPPPEGSIDFKL